MVQPVGADLSRLLKETLKCRIPPLEAEVERQASFAMIHRSILAGVFSRQFGLWDADNREYRGAGGRSLASFPVPACSAARSGANG